MAKATAKDKKEVFVAIDFETYYDTKSDYTLQKMTPVQYVNDPRFDAYLVSIAKEDGTSFAKNPAEVNWAEFDGVTFLAHNAAFDSQVFLALEYRGVIPKFKKRWICTADMAAFLGYPRNLAGALEAVTGDKMSKQIRSDMDGKHFRDAVSEGFATELLDYAKKDAEKTLLLWQLCGDLFPDIERKVSAQNRLSGRRGVCIDVEKCKAGIKTLKQVLQKAMDALPWVAEGKAASSTVEINRYCVSKGVEPPTTWSRKDLEFKRWEKTHPEMKDIIEARLTVAGMGAHIGRLEKMLAQTDDQGVMRHSIKYFGSHTGRYASGRTDDTAAIASTGPVNLLNLPKNPVHDVDMRGMIIPPKGFKLVTVDYSQIEPRVALWLAKDQEALDAIFKAEGRNIYWAAAVKLGWITPTTPLKEFKANKQLYALTKAVTIGLTYGMGVAKFFTIMLTEGTDIKILPRSEWPEIDHDSRLAKAIRNGLDHDLSDLDNPELESYFGLFFACDKIVCEWRAKNTKIMEYQKRLEAAMVMPCSSNLPAFAFRLPSGRNRPYFRCCERVVEKTTREGDGKKVTRAVKQYAAATTYNGPLMNIYGGILLENLVQSLSRDIMAYSAYAIEEAHPTYNYWWSVHDELIFAVPEAEAAQAKKTIEEMMCSNKYIDSWIQGLPLAVEGEIRDCYGK